MAISSFYNTVAIYEIYTSPTDTYGQEVKTWTVSTTIKGTKQGRSGSESVINTQERISKNEKFYCDFIDLNPTGRLAFSTRTFVYAGTCTSTGALTGGIGSMYFCSNDFSTYSQYDYAINVDSTYVIDSVTRNNILYKNDQLRGHHLQIDLDLAYGNKS